MRLRFLSPLSFLFRSSLPNDYLTIRLEKASRDDICPICTFEGEARYIWIWSFLWENVNNPDARDEFISAGGLCPGDLWRTVEVSRNVIKSSLGVAMVFQHLVKIVSRALETGRSTEPWIDAPSWNFHLGRDCQACATAENAARRSASRLLLAVASASPPRWLESAFPLCRAHFSSLVSRASRPQTRHRLADLQNAAFHESSKARRSSGGLRRLEAAIKPLPSFHPVPMRSESVYVNASERCPVCERLIRLEGDLPASPPSKVDLCLAHYRAASTEGTALYARFTSREEPQEEAESVRCPSCLRRRDLDASALDHTVSQIREHGAKDLLCLSHLTRALGMLTRPGSTPFLKDQLGRMDTLIRDLDDFIALHDYRYRRQPAENPDSPYRWALRFLASEPSIFAHHLPMGGCERFLPSRRRARQRLAIRSRP